MDGWHTESTVTREGLAKTIGRELGRMLDNGLTNTTKAVAITFKDDTGVTAGYVGDKSAYIEIACETLIAAIVRELNCETDKEMVDWVRYCIKDSVLTILAINALTHDPNKLY